MKVFCACTECKYNDDEHMCTRDAIEMSWHSVMTIWNGRQEFMKCKQYEMSDEAKHIFYFISEDGWMKQ